MTLINDSCPTYLAGNFNPSQLDFIFVKNTNCVKQFGHFPAVGISNHQAIYCILNFYTTKREVTTYSFRNFNNVDANEITRFIASVDWGIFSYGRGVDAMIDDLYLILHKFLNELFPLKQVTTKYKSMPWMTDEIKDKMGKRKIFYDWWHLNRKHQAADIIYDSYKKLNNGIKYKIRDEKQGSFINKYRAAQSSGEKWNLIHKFGVTRKAQKAEAHKMNIDKKIRADDLNDYFARLTPLPETNLGIVPVETKFDFKMCTSSEVLGFIRKIKSNSTGPDGIPPKCFKLLAGYISEPKSVIINSSIVSVTLIFF